MTVRETVDREAAGILSIANSPTGPDVYDRAKGLLARLLADVPAPALPEALLCAPRSNAGDYRANWNHQVWYHLTELARIREDRQTRQLAQGGDAWTNVPKPDAEQEFASQLRELAKLRDLLERTPRLEPAREKEVIFEDARLDKPDAWDHPAGLAVERDPKDGACWQGQEPGGDWFWLKQALPARGLSIQFDLKPVSTVRGGLIVGFCARPLRPGVSLKIASGPRMGDYFNNFDSYHFSVNRGASGFCNLRRCGPGLIMLASFPDPCPEYGRWYALEIVKRGPQVELRVERRLAVCYVDLGFIAPLLDGGCFGLRHFQGFRGWQRNVRIAAVE